ncbi:MAG: hypothetical protein JNL58_24935 [Planctomyces sp.]|nr:hypothetical protein [Planctomyces sp.]
MTGPSALLSGFANRYACRYEDAQAGVFLLVCLLRGVDGMAAEYFIACQCGWTLSVQLFEAGTTKACPKCASAVRIPSSIKLQQAAGDCSPYLSAVDKLRQAAKLNSAPFNGTCHACNRSTAVVAYPITLQIMEERQISNDEVIRPSVLGGAKLVVPAAEERWSGTKFPLMLCEICDRQFSHENRLHKYSIYAARIVMFGSFTATGCFAWANEEKLAWMSGLVFTTGMLIRAFRSTNTKRIDAFAIKWLSRIRWVPEILESEDEFRVIIGGAQSDLSGF